VPSAPTAVFIVGTRAQLIKVAPVVVACEQAGAPVRLLMTGQHKETMEDLVAEFGIRTPREEVIRLSERATVGTLLAWVPRATFHLVKALKAVRVEDPGARVVVHGDTASSVLGALAAKWARLQVYHLESGLTSGRLFDPFPEELSRRIVFRLTDVALCPGAAPSAYMRKHYRCRVEDTVENTIVDAVQMATRSAGWGQAETGPPYIVASLHRFQNLFEKDRLRFLVSLLETLSQRYRVHFVLHPATRKRLVSEGLFEALEACPGIHLSPRLAYSEFLRLAGRAECVLTDGGSNQEELAVLGVPTLVMRQATERQDGLGENAIMEGDVGDVASYLLSGRFVSLRRPSRVLPDLGPSRRVAETLAM
jgi:UDP-N-acetylglucosamine 2-epimerase (non-hydrolysing)